MTTSSSRTTDSGFRDWSNNFAARLVAEPLVYGVTAAQAAAFQALATAYDTAYTVAKTPETRTHPAILAKNTAKAAASRSARLLIAIVRAVEGITNEQLADVGLPPRTAPTISPIPSTVPVIEVTSAKYRTVSIRIHDSVKSGRGKPAHVVGAALFSYVGDTPPANPAAYKFEGNLTRTTANVVFADSVPDGTTVWFCAFWFNSRGESGAASEPVSTSLPGGTMRVIPSSSPLRMAA